MYYSVTTVLLLPCFKQCNYRITLLLEAAGYVCYHPVNSPISAFSVVLLLIFESGQYIS